jgi:phosphoglucosamine mutase
LPDAVEQAIEAWLDAPLETMPSGQLGKARRIDDAAGRYIEFCKSTFPNDLDLRGLKLVVDCAHGATYHIAGHVFHELGAEVITIGNLPDGLNINRDCGATHPQAIAAAVKLQHAHLGIAFDGDGDRLVMADADGRLYDGDQLLYVIARFRHARELLKGGVVGTLMTNFAMEQALAALKIPFERAAVGDRYVLEKLVEKGWQIGGENSGHIICLDKHTTGDGIVSALQVLHALRAEGRTLGQLCADLTLYPQVLVNVKVAKGFDLKANLEIQSALRSVESALGGKGRVLLRASGTEPVVRVMVETTEQAQAEMLADSIADVIRRPGLG